jgi:hypothetical protein
MDAVNATQIANPKDAYTAIATDPKFASLLEQVPLNIPPSYMKRLLHFCFAILFFVLKTEKRKYTGYIWYVSSFVLRAYSSRIG